MLYSLVGGILDYLFLLHLLTELLARVLYPFLEALLLALQ